MAYNDKIIDVLEQIIKHHRHTEKNGGNGIKEFLEANKEYKLTSETIYSIKKAIILYNEPFKIKLTNA